jgi:hypothetical protein
VSLSFSIPPFCIAPLEFEDFILTDGIIDSIAFADPHTTQSPPHIQTNIREAGGSVLVVVETGLSCRG